MPYKAFKRDDEWCVYKVDENEEPTGDTLGCHPSEDVANEQVAALYASEPGASKSLQTPSAPTALKALPGDGSRIGGYMVVWGSPATPDAQGEFFTPATKFMLEWFERRPALYHHGLDGSLKSELIGVIDTLTADSVGLWAEAQLDLRRKYVATIKKLVDQGVLAWSSGSLPHLAKVAPSGEILEWPLIEGSLTPTPSEYRGGTAVAPLKHLSQAEALRPAYKALDLDPARLVAAFEAVTGESRPEETPGAILPGNLDPLGAIKMTDETKPNPVPAVVTPASPADVDAAIEAYMKRREEAAALDAIRAKAARADELETELAALKAAPGSTPDKRLPGSEKPTPIPGSGADLPFVQVMSEFDGLKAIDMTFGLYWLKGFKQRPSERYGNALAVKIAAEKLALPRAMKSDELSYSTQASYGDEWVPDLWSAELWRKARADNMVLPLFRVVEMPSNPYELPIESTDPTVYFVEETQDESQLLISGAGAVIPDSKVGTGKVTLNAGKLGLRVGFSAELVEDSIIPVLPAFREQAMRALQDSVDNVLINGDTETGGTGNINSDAAARAAGSKDLIFNGLRKLPIVTTTANKLDAAGAATLSLIRQVRFLMATQYSYRPNDIAMITDPSTYAALLGLPEFLTLDKVGDRATVLAGMLGMIDGVPLIVSAEMPLTDTDGKITVSGSNTKGGVLFVHKASWVVGYRRRTSVSVDFIPYYDAYQMTTTVRLAFINQNADCASLLYNVTV